VVSNYGNRTVVGNSLTVIDLATASVARTIDLGEHHRPHGVKFFPGDTLLAVTSEVSKAVLLVDFRTDRVVAVVPTTRAVSHMLALSAAGDLLYTTNIVDGSITAIDPRSRQTLGVTPIARMVEGLAMTPDGSQVWVGSNQDSLVVVFDTRSGRAVDSLEGFGMPYRLGITPNGQVAVISDPAKGQVRIVDVATRKVRSVVSIPGEGVVATSEFPGSSSPEGVAVSGGKLAFVTLQGQNQVAALDLETGRVVWRLPVGTWPDGIAFAPPRR
jgi:DNA-binding beta-propeller fold protein YncE